MPLVLNDVRERMKSVLVKPEELVKLTSLTSSYKSFKKLNNELSIEEQLKMYNPTPIDLKDEGDEKKVYDPYNMTEGSKHITYMETGASSNLSLDDTISLEERRLRKVHSHKPDFCGSCKAEQRFDGNKYCHSCMKDPHYNPENLDIGSKGKSTRDYDPNKTIDDPEGYWKYKNFMKN
jgi:hypothetical protein